MASGKRLGKGRNRQPHDIQADPFLAIEQIVGTAAVLGLLDGVERPSEPGPPLKPAPNPTIFWKVVSG